MTCTHDEFHAHVRIAKVEQAQGPEKFAAEVSVSCKQCGTRFQFVGLDMGHGWGSPTVSADGLEANLPLAAEGTAARPCDEVVTAGGFLQ